MKIGTITKELNSGAFSPLFSVLYGKQEISRQIQRYLAAIDAFHHVYPEREDVHIFSAPGRTEIGGNHTDHQHGCVLAAAVHMDMVGVVAFHDEGVIQVLSEGYEAFSVSVSDLEVRPSERNSAALVRGVIAAFQKKGISVGGFDMYCTSDVLSGSGISSSAAFETLLGTIIDNYYANSSVGAVEIGKIGQFAENVYFGKKSGLMDQMVSSVGGLVSIDFIDTNNPKIDPFQFDFEAVGYCLCLTDTKGSHADLTDEYDAIRTEMESVAKELGGTCLREVDESVFYASIPVLRKTCSDRALIRAVHFFEDNRRAIEEATALKDGNFELFLSLVRQSGASSQVLLQNLYSCKKPGNQEIPLALMLSEKLLGDRGAVRVHGGGFAGTIQAFVPCERLQEYVAEMNRIFGDGACVKLNIRPYGGLDVTKEFTNESFDF